MILLFLSVDSRSSSQSIFKNVLTKKTYETARESIKSIGELSAFTCLGYGQGKLGSFTVFARFSDGPTVYFTHFPNQVQSVACTFSIAFIENLLLACMVISLI
jgi:hypothetical protein